METCPFDITAALDAWGMQHVVKDTEEVSAVLCEKGAKPVVAAHLEPSKPRQTDGIRRAI